VTDPWDEDDRPPPRRLGWGCLLAVIITSVACVVAAIMVLRVVASTFPW